MLEVLNKRTRNIDMDNFKRIKQFWKKELVKNQTKIFKWLSRFSYNEVIEVAPKFNAKQNIDYNDYLAFVNNANNLIFVKTKKMTEHIKVINKLRKMLGDYGVANAFYSFLITINEFFAKDSLDSDFNKRKIWVGKYNEYIDQMWDRYQKEYLEIFASEPELKSKAADAFNFDKQTDEDLFFPKTTLEVMLTFMRKAVKNKKATEKQFNTVYLNGLFFYYYMYSYNKMMKRLLLNYPGPRKEAKKFAKIKKKEDKEKLKEAKMKNKKDSH